MVGSQAHHPPTSSQVTLPPCLCSHGLEDGLGHGLSVVFGGIFSLGAILVCVFVIRLGTISEIARSQCWCGIGILRPQSTEIVS